MRGGEVERNTLSADVPAELDLHLAPRPARERRAHVPDLERRGRHADGDGRLDAEVDQLPSSGSEDVVGSALLPFRGHADRRGERDRAR